jgi:hypothetical protein
MKAKDGRRVYVELSEHAAVRTKVLSTMLEPLTTVIDRYGELICQVTLILGKTPPASGRDAAIRDLMADVFDFLMETRPLISKGKVAIAYPLARRAYESLSLMIACHLDESLGPQRVQDPQGRRRAEWNRHIELPLPNAGIMVRGQRSHRIRGWQEAPLSLKIGVHPEREIGA